MPLRQRNEPISGPWVDDLFRAVWYSMPGHEPDTRFVWACGRCPYFNSGPLCTKCGAPRHDRIQSMPIQGAIAA